MNISFGLALEYQKMLEYFDAHNVSTDIEALARQKALKLKKNITFIDGDVGELHVVKFYDAFCWSLAKDT